MPKGVRGTNAVKTDSGNKVYNGIIEAKCYGLDCCHNSKEFIKDGYGLCLLDELTLFHPSKPKGCMEYIADFFFIAYRSKRKRGYID